MTVITDHLKKKGKYHYPHSIGAETEEQNG